MTLGSMVLLSAAVFILMLTLANLLLKPPSGITTERSVSRTTCWVGELVEVRRRITVPRGIGSLFVQDTLPEEMLVEEGNNFRVIWKWPWKKSCDLSYRLRCPKRGRFNIEETIWESETPMGFRNRVQGNCGPILHISVVPRLEGIRRVKATRAMAVSPFPHADPAHIGVSATDFLDLRPYSSGDPIKTINWKASARLAGSGQPLLVNKYEPEGRKAIWLFLDGAPYMEVGTSLSNPMEHAIEATSSLGQFFLSRGYTLGAYIYNNPAGALPPDVGQEQFNRLSQLLLTLRTGVRDQDLPAAVEWCKKFLFRLHPLTFIITRLDAQLSTSTSDSSSFRGLLNAVQRLAAVGPHSRKKIPVCVVSIEGSMFLRQDDPLEKHATELMRWESHPLLGILRRTGASVLEWNPSREEFAAVLLRHLRLTR